jgi:eukaryotic-like serine/threonine-protein kinase
MKTHLGHYEITEELGRGGMGVVYKGFEPALNRFVAIKELSPSLAHDANLVERFLREARSMAALNDPHIIQIYFIGTDEESGQPFFAMEFVDGDSLSGLLKRDGKLSVENALKVLHQTAQGLSTAHDRGVIHRDIKPGNLMISSRGNVKIADFGIALATQDFSKKLTSTGEFVGTPGYLSPEVCTGRTVDQRSDIFALGIVLFEMLSGSSPFTDESPLGLMLEVVKAEIPDIRAINSEVDADTAAILVRMLAKEPADRFQDCHELAAALQAHPLVARGGTIRIATPRPAASDATVVGAPTPASPPQPRAVTPPPVIGRTGSAGTGKAEPVAAVSAHAHTRASSTPPPAPVSAPRKSSIAMPLAIAAAVLLMIGGGAYAVRGPVMAMVERVTGIGTASTVATVAAMAGAVDETRSLTDASAPVASAGIPATGLGGEQATLHARAAESPAVPDASIDVSAGTSLGSASGTPALERDDDGRDAAQNSGAGHVPMSAGVAGREDEASDAAPHPPGRPLARAARDTLATTASPPRRVASTPVPPRVAVVALGDPALTGAVRQQIEAQLSGAGFDLVESSMFVSAGADLAGVMSALRGQATAVVVVQTEHLGQRELQFYGRSDTQYSANLSVRAYAVDDRRPLGPGFAEKVDFTTLNASTQAEAALGKHAARIMADLSPYRRRG